MKQLLIFLFIFNLFLFPAYADESQYFLGTVERIISEKQTKDDSGSIEIKQEVQVNYKKDNKLEHKIIEYGGEVNLQDQQKVSVGQKVVLNELAANGPVKLFLIDKYRLPITFFLFLMFCLLISFVAGKQGILSLIGLLASISILTFWVAPQIINGTSPLLAGIVGSMAIGVVSMYLAHGFSMRTTIALVSTFLTLIIAIILSFFFVKLTALSGIGSEDAFFLQLSANIKLNLQGVLLAGIIIGTLGILDDITATQVAAIDELKQTNKNLGYKDLYKQGFNIGREHILSMVNTLALAYAGASFPMFLMLTMPDEQPLWVSLNSELIIEEIVRTLVGSISLVLAVPIASALGAWYHAKK